MRPPSNASQVRVAAANSGGDSQSQLVTDGRTDEPQTKIQTAINEQSATRAHVQGFVTEVVSFADVLKSGFMHTGRRFPVTRVGQRAEIPWHIRAAVYYRDGGVCQKCKADRPKPWHLDHIVPWSSGGVDSTDNLRLLCEPCNVDRSNYDDGTVFAKRPVTWWCHRCYSPDMVWRYNDECDYAPWRGAQHVAQCPQLGEGHYRCRVEANYEVQLANDRYPTWHQRGPMEDANLVAFCAHCGVVGMTDVTL